MRNISRTKKVELPVAAAMKVTTNRGRPFFCFYDSTVVELAIYRNEPKDGTDGHGRRN